ncbi:MAG: choice-of-anchor L domain-containing protein [Phycisphaerae bacterium]
MTSAASAGIVVNSTPTPSDLATALNPSGLQITAVTVLGGAPGQIGTYADFSLAPITIADGIVLSSGDVTQMGPPADPVLDFPQPSYDMGTPGTLEFDAYGSTPLPGGGTLIENFFSSNDVAAIQVDFALDNDSQVQFDFVFGTVEFPYWTSLYTDAFLVFLDGVDPASQITFDRNGNPVQVGVSFTSLVSTDDLNTAFAFPHGLLVKLTTTTAVLPSGDHTIRFEMGDVNDHILDSAVFISRLRTGTGHVGTEPEHGDVNGDGRRDGRDVQSFVEVLMGVDLDQYHRIAADMNDDGSVDVLDVLPFVDCLSANDC